MATQHFEAAMNSSSSESRPSICDVAIKYSKFQEYAKGDLLAARKVLDQGLLKDDKSSDLHKAKLESVSKTDHIESIILVCEEAFAKVVNYSDKYFFLKQKLNILQGYGTNASDLKEVEVELNETYVNLNSENICMECDKTFSCPSNLKKHMNQHASVNFCNKCRETFDSIKLFNDHKKIKGTCKFTCICGKTYVRKCDYDKHVGKFKHVG